MPPRNRRKPTENHIDTSPDAFGLVSEPAIAAMLRRDPRTLQRWQSERSGPPFILVGNERRYHPEHVKQWLMAREQQPRTSRRVGRGQ
jgi:phage terminase Nu1 subunit (DNA packaging protein)